MSDSAQLNRSVSSRMQAPSTVTPPDVPIVQQVSSSGMPAQMVPPVAVQNLIRQDEGQKVSSSVQAMPVAVQRPVSPAVPPSVAPHKEAAPMPIAVPLAESVKPVEVLRPSTPEVAVPPEIKEIVSVSDASRPIQVDVHLQKAGVHLAGDSVPVIHTSTGDVQLPMTYGDALAMEKRTPFLSALHWFAAFVAYQWRKLDPTLKTRG